MVMTAETRMNSPYDVLRPVRCTTTVDGRMCNAKGDNIDWGRPQILNWKCQRCKTQNLVVIVEASSGDSTGPL